MWKPTNEAGKIHIAYSLTFNVIVLRSPDTEANCFAFGNLEKKRNGKRENEKEQATTKKK